MFTTLVALCSVLATACTGTPEQVDVGPGPEQQIEAFASSWEQARIDLAGQLTDAPDDATEVLGDVLVNLRPDEVTITPVEVRRTGPDTAESTVTVNWDLDAGPWEYTTTWNWLRSSAETDEGPTWTLAWSPAAIHPRLGARQTLAVRTTPATPGLLTDRNNAQIVAPTRIYSVVLLPDQVPDLAATAARLAALLTPIDPAATAETIVAEVTALRAEAAAAASTDSSAEDSSVAGTGPTATDAPDNAAPAALSYTVTNLREDEYLKVRNELDQIGGLSFPSEMRTLPLARNFARTLLGEVTAVIGERLSGKPGWRVATVDTTGADLETLTEQVQVPGEPVTLTIDATVQLAAEQALGEIAQPAVLVAIQPSTGEILAVAQNTRADELGAIALTGLYPPGSTFKIVTATAALSRGIITPESDIACPATVFIEGREINNGGFFDLGVVPVRLAVAKSCNTTFAQLATQMPPDALTEAARYYGIGLDFVIEGITTLTGQVPPAVSVVQRAENGFGQGEVLLTPFSAAMMAATAAAGSMPTPLLIRGTTTTVDQPAPVRDPAVQRDVASLMRSVVTEGTAEPLADLGEVHAKTGTAQYVAEDGADRAHAWTAGYRGDLAFAAFAVDGDNGGLAVGIIENFLEALPR